jgi:hypothetical protein
MRKFVDIQDTSKTRDVNGSALESGKKNEKVLLAEKNLAFT